MTFPWRLLRRGVLFLSMGLAAVTLSGSRHLQAAGMQRPDAGDSSIPRDPRAVLDQYCVTCHNQRLKTGGLALDTLDMARVNGHEAVWEKVVQKLRGGTMPPAGRPRPDHDVSSALVSYLVTALDNAAAATPRPGRTDALRRLNRLEYKNAIRDLFDLDIDVSSLLPPDDSSNGFDNLSLAGFDPGRLERYLAAAKKVSRLAVGGAVPSPSSNTIVLSSDLPQTDRVDGLPFGTRGGTSFPYLFPLDAEYEFQLRLSRGALDSDVNGLTEPHQVVLTIDGVVEKLFTVVPPSHICDRSSSCIDAAPPPSDAHLNIRIPVKAGSRTVGATFVSNGARLSEKARTPFQRVFTFERTEPSLSTVTILGPFNPSGPGDTPSRRKIFVCRPDAARADAACARRILSTLARRAFRRPVTDADMGTLLAPYTTARTRGDGFEPAVEDAIRGLLARPEFLFRIERDPPGLHPGSAYRVSGLELASRLSFFLWSSIPDDELLETASRGRLKDPRILERQVRRMLADQRSETLVTNFASQWLHLRNLSAVQPNATVFPNFDESLRQSLLRETELFVESIIREDRSAMDLVGADYSYLNERLARHYGIPDVHGSHFRRITFGPDSVRGGLLGQGSILTVTAYAHRTSPVVRGKWILQNILGTPPPPPPANVPPLPDSKGAQTLSMRDRMVQHRRDPACASCHVLMDPIGLSMENFDATGAWRDHTEAFAQLDVTGSLPDGTIFEGIVGLKKALLNRSDAFIGTLSERLLTYALGRPLESYDSPAIRKIVRDAGRDDFRFSSIIMGIVRSAPFQMRALPADSASESTESIAFARDYPNRPGTALRSK